MLYNKGVLMGKRHWVGDVLLTTASTRLNRRILFQLVQMTNRDSCFQCGKLIETVKELSVEHMVPHRLDPELFWDLDNISFSHLKCNWAARDTTNFGREKTSTHGMYSYYTNYGCRCDKCINARRIAARVHRGVDKPQ